jgi:hypothetical protein
MNLKEPLWQPPGMPIHQRNANVVDGLLMRVGIPHSGGKLAFHAFNEGYAAMVSASAFWNTSKARFRIPEATDLTELDFALDSAAYTAMKLWQAKGRQRGIAGVFLGRMKSMSSWHRCPALHGSLSQTFVVNPISRQTRRQSTTVSTLRRRC